MMTMEKAHRIIEAGIAKAKQIGQPMNSFSISGDCNHPVPSGGTQLASLADQQ